MNEFLKMDIFFVVATIAVVAVTVLVCAALVYVVRFMRTLNRISDEVEEEAKAIRADLVDVRTAARLEGAKLTSVVDAALGSVKRMFSRRKKRSS